MKILITGASGFIGSYLVSAACATFGSNNIVAFSSKNTEICQSIVYNSFDFDLSPSDYALLADVEVLIHAGAFTPKSGMDTNVFDANNNIHFTENLLNLPFENLKKIIYLSTIDVYEAAEFTSELTPTLPLTLYGFSKLYCERMITLFAANNNCHSQILRIGHVYGPGEEKYAKFLPKAIKSVIYNGVVELWGDGTEIRSFIYIDDVIKAIIKAIDLRESPGVINVVSGIPISIRALIDKLIEVSGRKIDIITRDYSGSKRNYIFDNKKLCQYLLDSETDFMSGLQAEYTHMVSLE